MSSSSYIPEVTDQINVAFCAENRKFVSLKQVYVTSLDHLY